MNRSLPGGGTASSSTSTGSAVFPTASAWQERPFRRDGAVRLSTRLDIALMQSTDHRIEITFDDGNVSDTEVALPLLCDRDLTASFFVCAGRIGEDGYLDAAVIRQLAAAGMGIGSHGWSHVDWRATDDETLAREIDGAREVLAETLAAPVDEVAIPFGSYDLGCSTPERSGVRNAFHSDGGRAPCPVDDPALSDYDCVDGRHDSRSRASGAPAHRAAAAHCRRYGQTIAATIHEETLTELRTVGDAFDWCWRRRRAHGSSTRPSVCFRRRRRRRIRAGRRLFLHPSAPRSRQLTASRGGGATPRRSSPSCTSDGPRCSQPVMILDLGVGPVPRHLRLCGRLPRIGGPLERTWIGDDPFLKDLRIVAGYAVPGGALDIDLVGRIRRSRGSRRW